MKNIHVVVGIIKHDGFILIAKRPGDKHQGNLWEFPGGKLLNKEDPYVALTRELREETGIDVKNARPLIKFTFNYPDRSIFMDVWLVSDWNGEVYGSEQQEIRWIKIEELNEYAMPPANEKIINAVNLPSLYLVCPKPDINEHDYLNRFENCLDAGVKLLQFRCGDEFINSRQEFIYKIIEKCENYGARILLNTTPDKAIYFNAHGIHLNSNRLMQHDERPVDHNKYVAASCHNVDELNHACDIGVDFIVLSPVKKTESHPGARPLGWRQFSIMVQSISVPVFALGGMQCGDMNNAWENGAQGIAIQRYIWQADNIADYVRKCLENC